MNRFDVVGWLAIIVGVGVIVALVFIAAAVPWWATLLYAMVGAFVLVLCAKVLGEAPNC